MEQGYRDKEVQGSRQSTMVQGRYRGGTGEFGEVQ